MLRRILGIVMIGLGLGCGTAQAHPHVFVTAAIAIRFDATGKLTGVDETFTFDDVFSSFSTQGLDTNGDGKLSREELAPLATTNITAMKEFDYYTYASHGKDWRDFDDPKEYWLEDKNGVLPVLRQAVGHDRSGGAGAYDDKVEFLHVSQLIPRKMPSMCPLYTASV